ncbi:MAG: class IV adenylate cyclase [Planctomycetota bacterium]|jgi:predicted adenylyl cyclase CyaB|nr:class IV adenylate cyclase [Planctomycetota bacterium]
MPLEIETKFKIADPAAIRRRLLALGAERIGGGLERNWVLDDAGGGLRRRRHLLRVRDGGAGGGLLTVKGPEMGGEFKTREEVNSRIGSIPDFLRQMEMLGFKPAWIYEKRRESWRWRGCAVELDECPEIGCFVEIEGGPDLIKAVAADLGLDPDSRLNDNYFDIWLRHLAASRQPGRDMVFPADSG